MSDAMVELARVTAELIEEMLRIDERANAAWRQAADCLRSGDLARAFELMDDVAHLVELGKCHANQAAKGVFVLYSAHRLESEVARVTPDTASGDDLQHLINLTTPPHAKKGPGGSDHGN